MNFVSITKENSATSKELYVRSFDKDEQREWHQIEENIINEPFDFFAVKDNERFIGIISLWNFDSFLYIEHFAITEELRDKGWGSKVLEYVTDNYGKPVVLEVDVPKDEISIRRVKFYEKNGFTLYDNQYIQPPYDKSKASVEMKIMSSDKTLKFSIIKDTLYKKVYHVTE